MLLRSLQSRGVQCSAGSHNTHSSYFQFGVVCCIPVLYDMVYLLLPADVLCHLPVLDDFFFFLVLESSPVASMIKSLYFFVFTIHGYNI